MTCGRRAGSDGRNGCAALAREGFHGIPAPEGRQLFHNPRRVFSDAGIEHEKTRVRGNGGKQCQHDVFGAFLHATSMMRKRQWKSQHLTLHLLWGGP